MGNCISGRPKKEDIDEEVVNTVTEKATQAAEEIVENATAKKVEPKTEEEEEDAKVFAETMATYDEYAKTGTYEVFYPVMESDRAHMKRMGYSDEHMELIPETLWNKVCGGGSSLHVKPPEEGQTIVDMGCGLGLDVILAAKLVGVTGKVYGIDISDAMLEVATDNCKAAEVTNIEFVNARIDEPLDIGGKMAFADRVISNGVFNLCKDKEQCYKNAYALLKEEGVFIFNDLTILPVKWQLPEDALEEVTSGSSWADWVKGCIDIAETKQKLKDAGFVDVSLEGWTEVYSSRATRGAIFYARKDTQPSGAE